MDPGDECAVLTQPAMSDVVLSGTEPASAYPADEFAGLIAGTPGATRSFKPGQEVSAHFRLYQLGADRTADVQVTATVNDAARKKVFVTARTVSAEQFMGRSGAGVTVGLGTGVLPRGEYLATLEAMAGRRTVTKRLAFRLTT